MGWCPICQEAEAWLPGEEQGRAQAHCLQIQGSFKVPLTTLYETC